MGGRLILKLPKYVSAFTDRHGKIRYRCRKSGLKTYYPKSNYPSQDFEDELNNWINQNVPSDHVRIAPTSGSINDLIIKYMSSSSFKGNDTTKAKKRSTLRRFAEKKNENGIRLGDRYVATCPFSFLDNYIIERSKKQPDGTGGPEAANRDRKTLKRMFEYAIKIEIRSDNPMRFVEAIPNDSEGFHCWTENEIEQYRTAHPIGTAARLAADLILWTARRPTDASLLGAANIIDDNYMGGVDSKTGKSWHVKISRELHQSLNANTNVKRGYFIRKQNGDPFSSKGFGNKFADWAKKANLPDKCRAHGLRKAHMRRLAESGASQQQIKAVSNHINDREVALYVRDANKAKMARQAIELLEEKYSTNG